MNEEKLDQEIIEIEELSERDMFEVLQEVSEKEGISFKSIEDSTEDEVKDVVKETEKSVDSAQDTDFKNKRNCENLLHNMSKTAHNNRSSLK